MKKKFLSILLLLLIIGCNNKINDKPIAPTDWSTRKASINALDSLLYGKSYLSIYSQIYSETEHRTYNLTAMVSIRNTSDQDTIYISSTKYFDTDGKMVKTYLEVPIYLAPMQTIEIIINEIDVAGGTGSNFLFEWYIPETCPEPIFEGIMSSITARGMSLVTSGKRIK